MLGAMGYQTRCVHLRLSACVDLGATECRPKSVCCSHSTAHPCHSPCPRPPLLSSPQPLLHRSAPSSSNPSPPPPLLRPLLRPCFLQILMSYLQVTSLVRQVALAWPSFVMGLLTAAKSASQVRVACGVHDVRPV